MQLLCSLCLIDTSVLVACRDLKDLDGLDWASITREDEIHIIVPDTANREIDKPKVRAQSIELLVACLKARGISRKVFRVTST